MRGKFGGFDEDAYINFVGQACGGSYISSAYTCRVGLSEASSAEEVGAALMGSSFEDYQKDYASFREKQLDENCKSISDRCFGKDTDAYPSAAQRSELDAKDQIRLLAANRALTTMTEVKEYDELGTSAGKTSADKMMQSKEFFDDVKWNMQPEVTLVTPGTLDMAWDGVKLNANYSTQFPGDKSAKFGQSRAGVAEHPFPSHSMKDGLREMKPTSARQVMDFAMRRNMLSITSAPEDAKFTSLGLKSSVPNKSDLMSRYTTAKTKTFVLDQRVSGKQKDTQTALMASAKNAKARGVSKNEWIGSIVRTPGRPPAQDVFTSKSAPKAGAKPKSAKQKSLESAIRKAKKDGRDGDVTRLKQSLKELK
jgi:hypothetical protein